MKCKSFVWFLAFVKRLFKKRFFVLISCLFPLFSMGISLYSHTEKPLIQVALYNEGGTSLASDTIASLIKLDSTIDFYETESAKQLYEDVKNTKAECGYIFTKDYQTGNILQDNKRKNAIKVVQSPSSLLAGSMNEMVFAAYFKSHNKELLLDYLQQPGILADDQNTAGVVSKASVYFENYTHNDYILQPKASDSTQTVHSKEELVSGANHITKTFLTDLSRGILSVLILLAALCGGMQMIRDRKNGLFGLFSSGRRVWMELLDIMTPAALVAVSGFIGILILPASHGILTELMGLLFYVPASALFTYVLVRLTRYGTLFHTLVPVLILGALIFPPVFMDFSSYARILTIPKYFFINTYYLNIFSP